MVYLLKTKNIKMSTELKTALYLDDERTPTETIPGYQPWIVVRNYDEFTEYITTNGIPDLISFDHDLAEEHMDDYFKQFAEKGFQQPNYESYKEKTGMDCANFLVEYCQRMKVSLKYCAVHSHNPVGAANIQSFINGFKKHMDETEDCFLMKPPFKIEEKK
jgi:hypothetical protein